MTKREIFDTYFINNNKKAVPRMPMVEFAPYWDLTLENWYKEGLDRSIPLDRMQEHLGLDPLLYLGIIPLGDVSMPKENGAPIITSEAEYEALLPRLYSDGSVKNVMEFIEAHRKESNQGSYMYQLTLNGFFWWPRTLLGIENHLFSFFALFFIEAHRIHPVKSSPAKQISWQNLFWHLIHNQFFFIQGFSLYN